MRKFLSAWLAGMLLLAAWVVRLEANNHELRHAIFLAHVYQVGDVELQPGMYIVVHRKGKDKAGEPCTFFYRNLSYAFDSRLSWNPSSAFVAPNSHRQTIFSHDPHKSKFSLSIMPFKTVPLAAAAPSAQVHCHPEKAPRANAFTMDSALQSDGSWRIRSIQFAGSTELHRLESFHTQD